MYKKWKIAACVPRPSSSCPFRRWLGISAVKPRLFQSSKFLTPTSSFSLTTELGNQIQTPSIDAALTSRSQQEPLRLRGERFTRVQRFFAELHRLVARFCPELEGSVPQRLEQGAPLQRLGRQARMTLPASPVGGDGGSRCVCAAT